MKINSNAALGLASQPLLLALMFFLASPAGAEVEQTLSFEGISCTLNTPDRYGVTERIMQIGKTFVLSDSSWDKTDSSALNISIIPSRNANGSEMLEGVLDPYRRSLTNYKEINQKSVKINGARFQSKKFTGVFPNGSATDGFVFVTVKEGIYFILIAEGSGEARADSTAQLLKSVKSFQIHQKAVKQAN